MVVPQLFHEVDFPQKLVPSILTDRDLGEQNFDCNPSTIPFMSGEINGSKAPYPQPLFNLVACDLWHLGRRLLSPLLKQVMQECRRICLRFLATSFAHIVAPASFADFFSDVFAALPAADRLRSW